MDLLRLYEAKERFKVKLFRFRSLEARREILIKRIKMLDNDIEQAKKDVFKANCERTKEVQFIQTEVIQESLY